METIGKVRIDTRWYRGEDPEEYREEDQLLLELLLASCEEEEELFELLSGDSGPEPADADGPQDEDMEKKARMIREYAERLPRIHNTYRCLYHFSPLRENLISWLPIDHTASVLELGAGGGALTGCLAGKAGKVCGLSPSLSALRINALRNQEKENILLYAGDMAAVLPELTETFDLILVNDCVREVQELLPLLMEKLSPCGHLAMSSENRLGLKYWAGCNDEAAGRPFAGIEGKGKGYSRKELQTLLDCAGGAEIRFYYPSPDHLFPQTIYSDRRLPGEGEIQNFSVDYLRRRLLLFSEPEAADSLIREELFPEFANSFLVTAKRRDPED